MLKRGPELLREQLVCQVEEALLEAIKVARMAEFIPRRVTSSPGCPAGDEIRRVVSSRGGEPMDLTIVLVGLLIGVGVPLRKQDESESIEKEGQKHQVTGEEHWRCAYWKSSI